MKDINGAEQLPSPAEQASEHSKNLEEPEVLLDSPLPLKVRAGSIDSSAECNSQQPSSPGGAADLSELRRSLQFRRISFDNNEVANRPPPF